jgi:anti-sigma factor RsiW
MTTGSVPPLTCRELVELVTAYLEGSLPAHERQRFDRHLAECAGCTQYLEQMRLTVSTLGRLPAASISPATRDRLLDAFRTWKAQR